MLAAASTQLLLPSVIIDLLNPLAMTSLPIIVYPMFDTDYPKALSAKTPTLYTQGLLRSHYTRTKMMLWVTEALYAGAVIGFSPVR